MIALIFLDVVVLLALAGILAAHLSGRAPRDGELRRRIDRAVGEGRLHDVTALVGPVRRSAIRGCLAAC
ncbi:MAG: hypothetical protein ACREQ5_25510 [Candidatus Dormibacteria bacterium]